MVTADDDFAISAIRDVGRAIEDQWRHFDNLDRELKILSLKLEDHTATTNNWAARFHDFRLPEIRFLGCLLIAQGFVVIGLLSALVWRVF